MIVKWNGSLRKKETTIRFHSETTHVLETILKPYFRTASFNGNGMNEPFAFNSHCDHSSQPNEFGKTIDIPDGPLVREATFWSRNSGYPEFEEGSPNIKLIVGDRYAGLLCPETQTLWATGWTHLEEYRPMTQHIINFLAAQGLLKTLAPVPKKKRTKKEKTDFTITIGGDPEFELIDSDGSVVNASYSNDFGIHEEFGNVGIDDSGYQVELRPSPGKPEVVVENVRKLLESFNHHYGGYFRLAASSDKYPCGGHIHIGVDPLPDTTYYRKLSNILDEFIGKNTIKLNGPARESGNEYNYGKIGDFRHQPYGMEYRTPPSAIWKNPNLTKVVLKLTYNLAINLANNLSLEFPTPVEKEALMSVGGLSEEEAVTFFQECAKPAPDNTECLLAAWKIERKVPKPKIKVTFHDSWYGSVKSILIRELSRVGVSRDINLTFYGLKEDRGDVYTFEIPDMSGRRIPHPHKNSGPTSFGFSKWFRDGSLSENRITEVAKIIGKIAVDIQNGKIIEPLPIIEEVVERYEPEAVVDGLHLHLNYRWRPDPAQMGEGVWESTSEG